MKNEFYQRLPEILDSVKDYGILIGNLGLFGPKPQAGVLVASICMQEDITLQQFFATYDMVNGYPRKKALACLAEFLAMGGKVDWIKDGTDCQSAKAKFSLNGKPIESEFTFEMAKKAGLVKGGGSAWNTWTANMLRARVISNAIGMLAPGIVAGLAEFAEDTEQTPPSGNLELAKPEPKKEEPKPEPKKAEPKPEPKKAEPEKKGDFLPGGDKDDVPMKFPATVNGKPTPVKKGADDHKPLDMTTLIAISDIMNGNYAKCANWMISRGWLTPEPEKPLKLENQAAQYLKRTLPGLSRERAELILKHKMSFIALKQS